MTGAYMNRDRWQIRWKFILYGFFWFRSHFGTTKLQPNGSSFIANPFIAQMMQFGLKTNRKMNSVDFPRKSPKPKTQISHNNRKHKQNQPKHINKYHEIAK